MLYIRLLLRPRERAFEYDTDQSMITVFFYYGCFPAPPTAHVVLGFVLILDDGKQSGLDYAQECERIFFVRFRTDYANRTRKPAIAKRVCLNVPPWNLFQNRTEMVCSSDRIGNKTCFRKDTS